MRSAFVKALSQAALNDPSLFLITADMGFSVLEEFEKQFPKQFLNVGISEQNAVSFAAGMASQGRNVFVYSIIPFITMRCFEQIRVDVAYPKNNVKLVGVGAGLTYGPAGATHHAIEDISLMRSLPGMTVLCPGDPIETHALVLGAASHRGPCYIRLGKNGDPLVHAQNTKIEFSKVAPVLNLGSDFLLLSTSNTLKLAEESVQQLATTNSIKGKLLSVHTLKPLDKAGLCEALTQIAGPVLTLEEHGPIGGLYSTISEFLHEQQMGQKLVRISLPDEYSHIVGSQNYLREHFEISTQKIMGKIRTLVG